MACFRVAGDFSLVEMVFIFIQALQPQKVPKNLKDIGVDFQLCVTDTDAIAIPDGRVATPFWIGIKISIS